MSNDPEIWTAHGEKLTGERARIMAAAFEKAFSECFYCDTNEAVATKFGQPICAICDEEKIRTSAPLHTMDDETKALQLKIAITMFKVGRKEEGGKTDDRRKKTPLQVPEANCRNGQHPEQH